MPISTINYANIPPQGDPLLDAISQGLMQGIQLRNMPKQMQADLQMKQAQAQREQALAQLPFGGQSLPGAAGQILGLETLKRIYGEDSSQYQTALKSFNLNQQSDQSRINYQNALSSTLPMRNLTPTGKSIVEQNNVGAGLSPTGQPYANPPSQGSQELSGIYDLLRQKGATDADTRKRNLFATNIEKTLSQINPDSLTQYAGINGSLNKLFQQSKAPFGQESAKFDDYQKQLQNVQFLTSQVRQFYGDSIQPDMLHRLQELNNPATWKNNPDLAKSLFNQTKNILSQETQTYRDALKNSKVFQGNSPSDTNYAMTPSQIQRYQQIFGGKNPNDPLGIR
jgi:hypothetical protein